MDKNNKKDKNKLDEELEEVVSDAIEEEAKKDTKSDVALEMEQKLEECENKYKRALADYQNLQKRVGEEKQDWIRAANRELLLRLLPVLDTLILANQHVDNEGLKVSINQFLDALKAEGVKRIETKGKDFDPHLMECVSIEDGEENKVLEEVRTGYMIYDKILRPAHVKVGKGE